MKILRQPDVSNWNKKHTCTNCTSELLIEESDLKYHYYAGDFREPSSESFSANCAVCNQGIHVPFNEIPKLIQINVKKKFGK